MVIPDDGTCQNRAVEMFPQHGGLHIHIKDNIYEVDGKGNYFRLVTLKTMHPNDTEFCSYDIAETLDKSMFWMVIIVM